MFKGKIKKNIDIKTADTILQNVLQACDAAPNNVSLEIIEERNKKDYKSDTLLLVIVSMLLAVTILIPLLFKSANAFVSVDPDSERSLSVTAHELTKDTFSLSFVGPVVDVSASYIEASDGSIILPVEYNRVDNKIIFPSLNSESNIYIYDINGKCLHLLFSPH